MGAFRETTKCKNPKCGVRSWSLTDGCRCPGCHQYPDKWLRIADKVMFWGAIIAICGMVLKIASELKFGVN